MDSLQFNTAGLSKEQLIDDRIQLDKIIKEARIRARHKECIICGKTGGFCNSHTIPQFCLNNIAWNGKLNSFNTLIDTDLLSKDSGIGNAGIFHMICRKCDGMLFQEYENPLAYNEHITDEMMNQIVLKNELRDIYKHETEIEMYKITLENVCKQTAFPPLMLLYMKHNLNAQIEARNTDLLECYEIFNKAKDNMTAKNNWLEVISYDVLDYVVPIAYQGKMALVTGANGEIINNIYTCNKKYKIEYLQLLILPLKDKTVILSFIDSSYKRYKDFSKYMNSVSQEERVEIFNKIIFWYTEDYYISKLLKDDVIESMKEVAITTQDILTTNPVKSLKDAMNYYDLRRKVDFPNILSKSYSIDKSNG